jgi:hypothetical protein
MWCGRRYTNPLSHIFAEMANWNQTQSHMHVSTFLPLSYILIPFKFELFKYTGKINMYYIYKAVCIIVCYGISHILYHKAEQIYAKY